MYFWAKCDDAASSQSQGLLTSTKWWPENEGADGTWVSFNRQDKSTAAKLDDGVLNMWAREESQQEAAKSEYEAALAAFPRDPRAVDHVVADEDDDETFPKLPFPRKRQTGVIQVGNVKAINTGENINIEVDDTSGPVTGPVCTEKDTPDTQTQITGDESFDDDDAAAEGDSPSNMKEKKNEASSSDRPFKRSRSFYNAGSFCVD